MGATHDQLRTDTGEVYDEAQRRYESLADVSAVELRGNQLPFDPSPGDILRSTGTEWEHLSDTEHGKLHKVVEGTVNAGHPDFTDPYDTTTRSGRASAVDDAITFAGNNSHPLCLVPDSLLDYDASSVTFDNSVRMVREGQIAEGHDIEAYGAAPSNTKSTNTDAFIAAVEAAESTLNRIRRVVGTRSGTFLVERRGFEIITVNADDVEIRLFDGVEIKLADNEAGGSSTRMLHIGTNSQPSNVKVKGGTWNQNRANNTGGGNQSNDALMTYSGSGEGVKFEDIDFRNSIGVHLNIQGAGTAEADWGEDALVEGCTFKGGGDGIFVKRWRDFRILGNSFRDFDAQDAVEPVGPGEQGVIKGNNFFHKQGSAVDIFNAGSGTFDYVSVTGNTMVETRLQAVIADGVGHTIGNNTIIDANQENAGGGGSGRASIKLRGNADRCVVNGNTLLSDGAANRPVLVDGSNCAIIGNTWDGHGDRDAVRDNGTDTVIRDNNGPNYKDANQGVATIPDGSFSVNVDPGMGQGGLNNKNIMISPVNNNGANVFVVDESGLSGEKFKISCDNDSGTKDVIWWVWTPDRI